MSDLTEHLVELIKRGQLYFEQHDAHRTVNPFTGEPGYVPRDPYPPGASEDDFAAFRTRTGVDLPDDIKVWLRLTDGAAGFFGVDPNSKDRSIEGIWEMVPDLRQEGRIPVGCDDFGNFYLRVVPKLGGRGGVYHVEGHMPDELYYVVASDTLHLAEFILEQEEALVSHETYGWPFDKSFVLSKDPEILNVENAIFAWKD
jgi:hypothetical protein